MSLKLWCNNNAPLGNSQARILIARCMQMITADEYNAMELILSVRNQCGRRYKIDYNSNAYKDCLEKIKPLRARILSQLMTELGIAIDRISTELRSRNKETPEDEQWHRIIRDVDRVSGLLPDLEPFSIALDAAPYTADLLKSVSVKLFHTLYMNMYIRFEHKYNHDRSQSVGDTLKLYTAEYANLLRTAKPNMS